MTMIAPYRSPQTPDDSAERVEIDAFERKVTLLPKWLRVTDAWSARAVGVYAMALLLAVMTACAASPLREALVLPTAMMAIASLVVLARRIRARRRR